MRFLVVARVGRFQQDWHRQYDYPRSCAETYRKTYFARFGIIYDTNVAGTFIDISTVCLQICSNRDNRAALTSGNNYGLPGWGPPLALQQYLILSSDILY